MSAFVTSCQGHRSNTEYPRAGRLRPSRRVPGLQELENRMLLSGGPTIYTVDSTGDTGSGTGTTGDLLYAVNQANANQTPPAA